MAVLLSERERANRLGTTVLERITTKVVNKGVNQHNNKKGRRMK
jgi:hypothetical protein